MLKERLPDVATFDGIDGSFDPEMTRGARRACPICFDGHRGDEKCPDAMEPSVSDHDAFTVKP